MADEIWVEDVSIIERTDASLRERGLEPCAAYLGDDAFPNTPCTVAEGYGDFDYATWRSYCDGYDFEPHTGDEIRNALAEYVGDFADDYDWGKVADMIRESGGYGQVVTLPADDSTRQAILQACDISRA